MVLPIFAIHLCCLLSSAQGYIDWCVPYWQPCTSISRAARYGAAYYVFKALMMPAALLQCYFWWVNAHWLVRMGLAQRLYLLPLGGVAGSALLVYVVALGNAGEGYYLLRRSGVIIYLGASFMGLIFLAKTIRHAVAAISKRAAGLLMGFCGAILLIGIASVLHNLISAHSHNQWEDVYEWWLVMLLCAFGLFVVWLWHKADLRGITQSGGTVR